MEMDISLQRACWYLNRSADAVRLATHSGSRKDIVASARRYRVSAIHCCFGPTGLRAPASRRWSLRLVISNHYRYTHDSGDSSHSSRLLDLVSLQWNTSFRTTIPGQNCPP